MVGIVSIAQALNISPSTVSRALTRPDLVAAETRTKVLAEAEKQGYVPRVWDAAEHHSGRQRLIGVLLADLANTFSARILNAILKSNRDMVSTYSRWFYPSSSSMFSTSSIDVSFNFNLFLTIFLNLLLFLSFTTTIP